MNMGPTSLKRWRENLAASGPGRTETYQGAPEVYADLSSVHLLVKYGVLQGVYPRCLIWDSLQSPSTTYILRSSSKLCKSVRAHKLLPCPNDTLPHTPYMIQSLARWSKQIRLPKPVIYQETPEVHCWLHANIHSFKLPIQKIRNKLNQHRFTATGQVIYGYMQWV